MRTNFLKAATGTLVAGAMGELREQLGRGSQQNYTSGVEAYPNVTRTINRGISSLSYVGSSFTVADDVLRWIQYTRGWMSNETLGKVQFGWEITTENPGRNFAADGYSVWYG